MKNVDYIIGNKNVENSPIKIFDENVCNFLNELSSKLLKSPIIRQYRDLSALAFWCRKANIQKIKEEFGRYNDRLGRGLCFHIAPSNIPINSIFSYFFGLLAGNSNIVRLSSKEFPQVNYVCDLIKDIIKNYPEIEKRTIFVKYERSNEISEDFSKIADCRMIWGGDKTIKMFKGFECKPRCIDITFPDRYSICMIDGAEIQNASDEIMKRVAENFYNDTYLMDQNACSSPQLIYWLNDNQEAKENFWQHVYDYALEKYNLQDETCVDKYTKFCEDAIKFDNIGKTQTKTNLMYRSEIKSLENLENIRGKGGYFYEYSLTNSEELFSKITDKYQTITYFGINPEELRKELINNSVRGVDRIVPIGKAMDIGVIWDGHDLIRELSRIISLE